MTDGSNLVTIRDIDVPFWRIVLILIKWSIAAIPAAIIVGIIYAAILLLLGAIGISVFEWIGVPMPEVQTTPG
ncbi:MAG: hypothetical protein H7X74_02190 [Methyloceanibacter sp.]|nr:hypothetical protein [Methyloceanibacter sp.]